MTADSTLTTTAKPRERVLLIKLGAIGDVVMAIPAAAALHQQGFAIDWVASQVVAPVLVRYPWINVLPEPEEVLLRGGGALRLRAMLQLWRRLRRLSAEYGPYALVATLYYDPRYRLLALPVRAHRRISLSRQDRRFELLAGRHHTDEYARILLGREDGETPTQLAPVPIPSLPPCSLPSDGSNVRIVLVPAGARNALRDDALRRWPLGHYVELAGLLLAQGFEVVLAGGPEDRWATPAFGDLAEREQPGRLVDAIGKYTLLETLALLDSAGVTVTHDTGPLHLAGITGTGLIGLFGPTDPHGRLPHRLNAVAFWGGEGFACRPCYDGREYAPCTHNGCMAQVTPKMVLHEVFLLLEARRTGTPLAPRVLTPVPAALVQVSGGAA